MKLVFHINVHKSPEVDMADDQLLNVKLGHSFTLNCGAIGDPEPNITWYRVCNNSIEIFSKKFHLK